jgi:hypothetical protein
MARRAGRTADACTGQGDEGRASGGRPACCRGSSLLPGGKLLGRKSVVREGLVREPLRRFFLQTAHHPQDTFFLRRNIFSSD